MEVDESIIKVLGICAGCLTSGALIPQVVKLYRTKKAEHLSVLYLIALMTGQALWITYGILQQDPPIYATNIFSILVSTTTIILGIRYKKEGE